MYRNFILIIVFALISGKIEAQSPYHPTKSYAYKVSWKHIPTSRSFDDLVILKCKRGRTNGLQRRIEWIHYPNLCADSVIISTIQMLFCDTVCDTKLGCQKNMHILNKMYLKAKTGVIDTKKEKWIHPPRAKYYKLLELSPFPWFLKDKEKYSTNLKLGSSWGVFSYTIVSSEYTVQKKGDNFFISATAKSIKGITEATFVYNQNRGFISCNYLFFNTYKVNMILQ